MSMRSMVRSGACGVLGAMAAMMMPGAAAAAPRARLTPDARAAGAPATAAVCSTGDNRCHAHVWIASDGEMAADAAPPGAPAGLGPGDLQSAYQLDASRTAPGPVPTIAIVDAYGYPALESDLGVYRAQFGLPPCTVASGCLSIVNQNGDAAPLPGPPPPSDDWTLETALDVDMASALCPRCKIVVVQATSPTNVNMFTAQDAAAAANPTVISDSWGAATARDQDLGDAELFFDHPGIAQFVSAGDRGYDEGGDGPQYPSTSAHVIAVGGTALVRDASARGWHETAWTSGGSSCSFSIAKPAHQTASPCPFRAASDIAAVGDPATGVAIYNAANGGWGVIGGTSAAAPIVAAIFASIGRGDITSAGLAQHANLLFDVTAGSNGTCGNLLCNAAAGWDGPTGYGTPSAAALVSGTPPPTGPGSGGGALTVAITSPADGATLDAGFSVTATASAAAVEVGLVIDGSLLSSKTAPPYVFATPASLSFGAHTVGIAAIDAQQHLVQQEIHVVVRFGGGGDPGAPAAPDDRKSGGCRVGPEPSAPAGAAAMLAAAVLVRRRRRR